jgi:hypothetical protein
VVYPLANTCHGAYATSGTGRPRQYAAMRAEDVEAF